MGRNIDRGLDKRVETQRPNDSGSKTPKMDQIRKDTSKKLSDNLNKKR
jgi:hypothetical protein